jgi:hypothetical protein
MKMHESFCLRDSSLQVRQPDTHHPASACDQNAGLHTPASSEPHAISLSVTLDQPGLTDQSLSVTNTAWPVTQCHNSPVTGLSVAQIRQLSATQRRQLSVTQEIPDT